MTAPTLDVPQPCVTTTKTFEPCIGCRVKTRARMNGRPGHHSCWVDAYVAMVLARAEAAHARPTPPAAAVVPADGFDEPTDPIERTAFQMLTDSIRASRKHPVLRVPAVGRNTEPWSLFIEPMRGEHRYRHDAPAGRRVRTLDRVGSYPSAMSNVMVAATLPRPTGAVEYAPGMAGAYSIPRFEWTEPGIGHPLGEIAGLDTETWMVTTPHLRLCLRLAAAGRIEAPRIVDSWTAPSATGLFKQFSADVQDQRVKAAAAKDPEVYVEVKTRTSIAIRGLWPKSARSPFWRPDWSLSARAEAAVRHWVRADQAVTAGAELVRLGAVDEAAFLVPKGAPTGWVPDPYSVGDRYGKVRIKGTVTAAEWNEARRGKR